ncbi:hypothetical protein LCGC14_0533430 [marine sediment metagenome]|uniref:Uncharacterized protein n=1 Tax=marine sediment metagenome TaxID=412755 RepID=A0A0F9V358_9ZZZZ
MKKDLKNFIKKANTDLGKDNPTVVGMKNFYRRIKAAHLIAKDVFGDDVEIDVNTVVLMYDSLVKEEIASVWMANMKEGMKGMTFPKNPKKKSVIADAPGIFDILPDKMSN